MRTKDAQRFFLILLLVSGCGDLQTLSLGSDLKRPRATQNTERDAGESESDRDAATPDAEVEDHEHEDEPRREDSDHDEAP